MAFAYKHLTAPKNAEPGVADLVYIALVEDFEIDGIACAPEADSAEITDLAQLTTITTDHEFKEGKGFLEIICAPFTNEVRSVSQGETGSKNLLNSITMFVPGNYADLHATIAQIKNKPLIVLAKDMNCSAKTTTQFGCDCVHAWVENAEYSSGQGKGGGRKGWTLTIESPANAMYHYIGAIVKMPDPVEPEPEPEPDPEEGG